MTKKKLATFVLQEEFHFTWHHRIGKACPEVNVVQTPSFDVAPDKALHQSVCHTLKLIWEFVFSCLNRREHESNRRMKTRLLLASPSCSFISFHSFQPNVRVTAYLSGVNPDLTPKSWVLGKQVKPEVQEDSSLLCKGWTGTMACLPHQRKGWATINSAFRWLPTDFTFSLIKDFLKWIERSSLNPDPTQRYQHLYLSLS